MRRSVLVVTTASAGKSLPKVIVTLAAREIEGLLAGGAERFPVSVGTTTYDVEMIAQSATPPKGAKPQIRLRVADGALSGARLGTVTAFFDGVPFQLVLMCSDPPPAGPVRLTPGLTYERIDMRGKPGAAPSIAPRAQPQRDDGELPLLQRVAIGAALSAIVAVAGYLRDEPLFYLVALGTMGWSVFGKTNPTR